MFPSCLPEPCPPLCPPPSPWPQWCLLGLRSPPPSGRCLWRGNPLPNSPTTSSWQQTAREGSLPLTLSLGSSPIPSSLVPTLPCPSSTSPRTLGFLHPQNPNGPPHAPKFSEVTEPPRIPDFPRPAFSLPLPRITHFVSAEQQHRRPRGAAPGSGSVYTAQLQPDPGLAQPGLQHRGRGRGATSQMCVRSGQGPTGCGTRGQPAGSLPSHPCRASGSIAPCSGCPWPTTASRTRAP